MGIPSWVRRGQKIVCVKLGGWDRVAGSDEPREATHPVLDGIYTIALIDPDAPGQLVMVTLDECHPEDFYWIERFKPLIAGSLGQDVALFEPLLDAEPPLVRIPHLGTVRA